MAIYDPFDQGYMHDWRLEEAVKEGVRRALRGRDLGTSGNEDVLRALRALAFQMEMAQEDAELEKSLRMLARDREWERQRYFDEW